MIVKDLKASVLDLAFIGKLVENSNNGIEELLSQINSASKKEITLLKGDIPSNWIITYLGDLSESMSDGVHFAPKYIEEGIPCYSAKDIYDDIIHDDNCNYISENDYKLMKSKINVKEKSLLVTKSGSIGRTCILDKYYAFGLVESVGVINLLNIDPEYVKYYFDYGFIYTSKFIKEYINGIAIKHLTLKSLSKIAIPVPPLDEQKRIVKKIKELFNKLDDIKPIDDQLQAIKKNFPIEMKKSILNCVYLGSINNNSNDNMWNCSKLNEIVDIYTGNSISEAIKKKKYMNLDNGYDYIATKDLGFNHEFDYENGVKIPFNEKGFKYAEPNDILMCIEGGSAGKKIGMLSEKVCFGNKLCKFGITSEKIVPKFLYYYLQSPVFLKNFYDNLSGIIGGVSINKIKNIVIKYPSIEEQKRIVNKIEQLLPLLNDIDKSVDE